MIDLLKLIHLDEISIEEAYEYEDRVLEAFHRGELSSNWSDDLGLDRFEATARAHGASYEHLVQFRYNGWPERCAECHQPIDYRDFGWFCKRDEEGKAILVHIYHLDEPDGDFAKI
jgi:hypothetical protein